MGRVVGSFAWAIAVVGLVSAFAAAVPQASAASNQLAQSAPAQAGPPAPAQSAAPVQPAPTHHRAMHRHMRTRAELVEIMIANMRTKLAITAAQQPQFDAAAGVMRANAKAMETLLAERARDTDHSAVASLRWYGKLTEAHAAALKNFTPAFETLYAALSDGQRKTADAMFLQFAARPFPPHAR